MRVGILTTRQSTCLQYLARDLAAGFRAIGHECELVCEGTRWTDYGDDLPTAEHLLNFVDAYKPAFIVQFNGNRWNHPPLGPDVAWVNWAMDWMWWLKTPEPDLLANWGPKDLTVAAFEPMRRHLLNAGHKDVRLLHVGYNAALFDTAPEPIRPEFQVDIAMLCNMPRAETRLDRIGLRWAALRPALWLAKHRGIRLGLFGAGWDQWEETAPYAVCNPVNGPMTKAIYQQARLHLHANEDMIIHMRPLECLGSGGRIAHYAPDWYLNDHDDERVGLGAMPTYASPVDLEYILHHPLRTDIPALARMHSTATRAQTLIDMLTSKGAL